MGIAAYNRGSKAIREQLAREAKPLHPPTALEVDLTNRLAQSERKIARATLALRLEAAKLTEERRRTAEAVTALEAIRDEFRGTPPSREHYIAILALVRVKRILGR